MLYIHVIMYTYIYIYTHTHTFKLIKPRLMYFVMNICQTDHCLKWVTEKQYGDVSRVLGLLLAT